MSWYLLWLRGLRCFFKTGKWWILRSLGTSSAKGKGERITELKSGEREQIASEKIDSVHLKRQGDVQLLLER